MKKNVKNDLIVFGATGFTGKLVVEYLIKNYGIDNQKFTWAIAGRDKAKLETLKQSLMGIDTQSAKIETYVADSFNYQSLDVLTSSCRIIISTVGPYLKYGLPLVESCVKNHTNYCDLTGEVPFIRESIDLFHEKALNNKCKIIHSCGFDSIPSDLGVLLLQKDSLNKFNKVCDKVNLYVRSIKGGISGGTISSMINIKKYIYSHPNKRNVLRSPYSLNPIDKIKNNVRQQVLKSVRWDNKFNKWTSPFLMSGVNTRVVQRTNAIAEFSYGENFKYNEMSSFDKGLSGFLKASTMLMILAFLQFSMRSNLVLWILKKTIFPKPGEGPSKGKMQSGFFKLKIIGSINEMPKNSVCVLGDSDPGYSATAKMLTESAISILLNENKIPKKYGVLTPASGIGLTLVERLKKKGILFKIE
tara:strand:- start:94 stop:1338 length:1245 start_codon:yes stop_codon:yes gene_type:complete